MVRRQTVFFTLFPSSIHHYSRHGRIQASSATFEADIFHGHDRAAAWAGCAGARHGSSPDALVVFSSLCRVAAVLWYVILHAENDTCLVGIGFHC